MAGSGSRAGVIGSFRMGIGSDARPAPGCADADSTNDDHTMIVINSRVITLLLDESARNPTAAETDCPMNPGVNRVGRAAGPAEPCRLAQPLGDYHQASDRFPVHVG